MGQKTSERVSLCGENSGHVLGKHPPWFDGVDCTHVFEREVAARVCERLPEACDGEGLTGRTADNDICFAMVWAPVDGGDVPEVGDLRIVVCKERICKRLNVRERYWFPTKIL